MYMAGKDIMRNVIKIGHVLQILTHQYFSQNKAHSIIAQNNVLSFKYIDYVIPILYR